CRLCHGGFQGMLATSRDVTADLSKIRRNSELIVHLYSLGSEPRFFRSIGDLQYGGRSERVPRSVRLGSFEIELPDRCNAIASEYHQGKVVHECAARDHNAIPCTSVSR